MKFRRKPVVRDVVDAVFIKTEDVYLFVNEKGEMTKIAAPDFERDYEPAKRDYVKRARKPRAKKGGEQP